MFCQSDRIRIHDSRTCWQQGNAPKLFYFWLELSFLHHGCIQVPQINCQKLATHHTIHAFRFFLVPLILSDLTMWGPNHDHITIYTGLARKESITEIKRHACAGKSVLPLSYFPVGRARFSPTDVSWQGPDFMRGGRYLHPQGPEILSKWQSTNNQKPIRDNPLATKCRWQQPTYRLSKPNQVRELLWPNLEEI